MPSASPTPLVNPLHLALGAAAAGSVRAACDSCGMPGAVVGFIDDLTHGPLADAEARAVYLRALSAGDSEADAPFSQWRVVLWHLDREHPDAIIIWGGANVADAIFLAMACERLAGRRELLWRVRVPEIDGRPYVAMHAPEQIARLFATRRPLSAADRLALAQDFARIRDTCGPVRRLEQGRVVGAPIDCYDHLLLAACGPDWRAAGLVVGSAMARCDGPNLPGDGFFGARLGVLVDAGCIEVSGPRTAPRDNLVRLANARQCPRQAI